MSRWVVYLGASVFLASCAILGLVMSVTGIFLLVQLAPSLSANEAMGLLIASFACFAGLPICGGVAVFYAHEARFYRRLGDLRLPPRVPAGWERL